MSWVLFILALPIVALGFLFEWARDNFMRGRAFYEHISSL
jgi:hypothetical protein